MIVTCLKTLASNIPDVRDTWMHLIDVLDRFDYNAETKAVKGNVETK